MEWTRQFFLYCERGSDPAFWAEPFNAVTNLAFVAAAAAGGWSLGHFRADRALAERIFILLAVLIGLASFTFHTTAARWALVADTASISVFSLAYMVYAIRRFAGARAVTAGLSALALFASLPLLRAVPCSSAALLPGTAAAGHPCFNGSAGYVPVLAALGIVSALLWKRRHGAASWIAAASVVFAVSLTFRALDIEVCAASELLGRARGTHAVWHLLNGLAVFLLLAAAARHGAPERSS